MNEQLTLTCEFYVDGMHCPACEYAVETQISKHKDVKNVKATLSNQKVVFNVNNSLNKEQLKTELNLLVKDLGYTLQNEAIKNKKVNFAHLGLGFGIAFLFAALFLGLQKLGIVNLLNTSQITLPFVFLIGIVASLSTCMAVVGGLVLSLASSYSKSDFKKSTPLLIKFHLARIIGFFILGGFIGLIGSAFTLTATTTFILNLVLFLVMVVMGINLLDIFPTVKNMQIKMPKFLSKKFSGVNNDNPYAPILLGISTFFLPCGFTQSMQVYSLSTGNYLQGALIMLTFALGTLPVLSLISFASVKLSKGLQSDLFFKSSGFLVLFFAIFNFIGALTALGVISPVFNF